MSNNPQGVRTFIATGEHECRQCDKEFVNMRTRYVCCNGTDCGCYGATIPEDFCSATCYENYDPTPWCGACGARKKADCHCGPIAEND